MAIPNPLRARGLALVVRLGLLVIALTVSGWLVLHLLWPDATWPQVLGTWAMSVALPFAPVVLLVALATKRWGWVAVGSIPLLVAIAMFGPYLRPTIGASYAEPELRVVTFNIRNDRRPIEPIAVMLEATDADVVMLQELGNEAATTLIPRLAQNYPHVVVGGAQEVTRQSKTALLSKSPLTDWEILDLGLGRPAIVAATEISGQKVWVASVHLQAARAAFDAPWRQRPQAVGSYADAQHAQVRLLLEELATRNDAPLLMGCDCNAIHMNYTIDLIEDQLQDPARQLGLRLGGDVPEAMVDERRLHRVDYQWYRSDDELEPTGVYRVEDRAGSDHAAIVADYRLTDPQSP